MVTKVGTQLRAKLILIAVVVNAVAIGTFSAFTYGEVRRGLYERVDATLLAAASGANLFFGPHNERIADGAALGEEEYKRLVISSHQAAKTAGLKYLYTVIPKDGKILFTLDSASPEEIAAGNFNALMGAYEDASEGLLDAAKSGAVRYDEYTDKYGSFRSIFVPYRTAKGGVYLVCADMPTDAIEKELGGVLLGILWRGLFVFVLAAAATFWLVNPMAKEIRRLLRRLVEIAEGDGDLTIRIDSTRKDEIGALAAAFNRFVEKIHGIVRLVASDSAALNNASGQMGKLSSDLSGQTTLLSTRSENVSTSANALRESMTSVAAAVEEASVNLSSISAATEEMNTTIQGISQNMDRASQVTKEAVSQTENANNQISALAEAARKIDTVTQAITEISEQTKLLALNATIEAARAGEAGKGFAVVAAEIKELAKQTAKATGEIQDKVQAIQNASGGTIEEIAKISRIIEEIDLIVAEIDRGMGEQSSAANDISRAVAEASQGVQEISRQVADVNDVSNAIAADIAQVSDSNRDISGFAQTVRTNAESVNGMAQNLNGMVRQFKV